MSIRMARDYKAFVRNHGYKAWVQKLVLDRGWNDRIDWTASGEVEARVYKGIWMAHCPNLQCNGAIIVDDEEPFMFCPDCLNSANDGKPYKVVFKHKEEVEDLFAKRKNPQTRNWLPTETLEDLMKEQEEHGEL